MKFTAYLVTNEDDQPLRGDKGYSGRLAMFQNKIDAEKYVEDYKELCKKSKNFVKRERRIKKAIVLFGVEFNPLV